MNEKTEVEVVAVHDVQDLVCDIERLLNQCSFLMQEVNENYFDKYSPYQNEEDKMCVVWEYRRYGSFADVVGGKIHDMSKVLEKLKTEVKL